MNAPALANLAALPERGGNPLPAHTLGVAGTEPQPRSDQTDVAVELDRMQAGLPAGLHVRRARPEDLPAIVAFRNAAARPAEHQSLAQARHFEERNPQPKRLLLLVARAAPAERRGALVAVAETGDGGVARARADGTFRFELRVVPAWRGRGIGTALLEALEAHARRQGAPRQATGVRGDEPEGLAFAERRGYAPYHQTIHSYVDVQAFDATRFDDPGAIAARAGAYLATYADLAQQHAGDLEAFQRQVYEVASEAMRDVPSPEPRNPPPFEAIRHIFFEGEGVHPETSILAVRDGRVVGLTVTTQSGERLAHTAFTGVARSDRGRGLALAMKLRAIAALRAAGVALFGTSNDEGNAPMRGINTRLGYVPDPPVTQVEKRLA
jgi:GNAT superfamily N-acetyltransferase